MRRTYRTLNDYEMHPYAVSPDVIYETITINIGSFEKTFRNMATILVLL
jgi:hypothetical protein